MRPDESVYGVNGDDGDIPSIKINRTSLPRGSDKVAVDNLVTISKHALLKIKKKTDASTRRLIANMLTSSVPTVLAFDNASSYVEAIMRDGLNIDLTVDDNVLVTLDALNSLSMAYTYSRMVKLPKRVRRIFVESLAEKMVDEVISGMRRSTNTKKYRNELQQLAAHVTGQRDKHEDSTNMIGSKKSRRN